MSKFLPYFQFEPAQYLTGTIQFCSLASQGLFVNIQCHYWQRECSLTISQLYRKFESNKNLVDELFEEGSIKKNGEFIIIEFLDSQYKQISIRTSRLSKAGKLGAKKVRENRENRMKELINTEKVGDISPKVEKQLKIDENSTPTFFYIGIKMYKVKLSDYIKEEMQITIDSFMPTMLPITLEQVLKQMDTDFTGTSFSNNQHVVNAFKKTARDLKNPRVQFKKDEPIINKPKLNFGNGRK